MTLRARTTKPPSIRTRIRSQFEGEDRQQATVTVLFALVIGAVVLILLGAIALNWYNENLRPLARVAQTEVGPQLLRNRLALEQWRLDLEGNRLTQANIDGQIDAETLAARQQELQQRATALGTTGLDDLIDVIYQSQLATEEGVTVTDADVDAAVAKELAGVEKRHILGIGVKPVSTAGADQAPSISDQRAALEKAEAALAALNSGQAFADVAAQYSTDATAQTGGDMGLLSEVAVPDANWASELFKLDLNGTTGVVRGADGVYRIGQVTEIQPAGEQPGLHDDLAKKVPDAGLRDLLRYEVGAQLVNDKITNAALAETPEQARIAIISVAGAFTDDPANAEGEVDYSEVVFAPNDDVEVAPELPEGDAAWEAARVEAQAAFDQLNALTAGETRAEAFRQMATDNSDSPTSQDGGAAGFSTRSTLPDAVGTALFDTPHTKGDLIGPIRGDAGYYVLLYNERRDSPEQRVQAIQDLLAQPGADFTQIAKDHSDGTEAADGGEVGWVTRDQLATDLVEKIFALTPGQVSEPIELQDTHYFIKLEEKANRALDPDQVPDVRANAFTNWFTPKRDQAKIDGVIVVSGEAPPDAVPSDDSGGG